MNRLAKKTTASTTSSNPSERIERILLLRNWPESLAVEARLEKLDIPFVVRAFNDPAFGSFWRKEEAWGALFAPAGRRREIEAAYRDLFGSDSL